MYWHMVMCMMMMDRIGVRVIMSVTSIGMGMFRSIRLTMFFIMEMGVNRMRVGSGWFWWLHPFRPHQDNEKDPACQKEQEKGGDQ